MDITEFLGTALLWVIVPQLAFYAIVQRAMDTAIRRGYGGFTNEDVPSLMLCTIFWPIGVFILSIMFITQLIKNTING